MTPGAPVMQDTEAEAEARRLARLLAAAQAAVAEVPICWVVTPTEDGRGANARAVRDGTADLPEEDAWTRWFVAPRLSRKVAEIRRTGRATLAYQHRSGEAWVTLSGPATLLDDAAAVRTRLRPVDDRDGTAAARLLAVRVEADHMEVHLRGVTAEPWGRGRTLLDRDPRGGAWRLRRG
jgi:general stress protein 26